MECEQVADMERGCSAERNRSSRHSEVRSGSVQKRTCVEAVPGPLERIYTVHQQNEVTLLQTNMQCYSCSFYCVWLMLICMYSMY